MLLWIIAATAAYFVKGICGFANTLVFSSILSFGKNNVNITPVDLLVGYFSNGCLAWHGRKEIRARIVLPLILLTMVGSIPAIFFLKNADAKIVKIIFGAVIILVAIDLLHRELNPEAGKRSKVFVIVTSIISGLLFGAYGIGALLSACVSGMTNNKESFKANLCTIFFIENTVRLILYIATDIITKDTVFTSLVILPFMALGLGAGILTGKHIDEKKTKLVVIVMLIISGAAVIINCLRA